MKQNIGASRGPANRPAVFYLHAICGFKWACVDVAHIAIQR